MIFQAQFYIDGFNTIRKQPLTIVERQKFIYLLVRQTTEKSGENVTKYFQNNTLKRIVKSLKNQYSFSLRSGSNKKQFQT